MFCSWDRIWNQKHSTVFREVKPITNMNEKNGWSTTLFNHVRIVYWRSKHILNTFILTSCRRFAVSSPTQTWTCKWLFLVVKLTCCRWSQSCMVCSDLRFWPVQSTCKPWVLHMLVYYQGWPIVWGRMGKVKDSWRIWRMASSVIRSSWLLF